MWQGLLQACSFLGVLSANCLQDVDLALRSLGRSLDAIDSRTVPSPISPPSDLSEDGTTGRPDRTGRGPSVPLVQMDLEDRMVLLKPVDWEVHDENMEHLGCKSGAVVRNRR